MLKWFAPLNVQFKVIPDMREKCFPRGCPHSSILSMSQDLTIDDDNQGANIDSAVMQREKSKTVTPFFSADGDLITVRGSLALSYPQKNIAADIHGISFEVSTKI
jgi:hypothetical protein